MALENHIAYYKKMVEELEHHEHKVNECRKEALSTFVAISSLCLFKFIADISAECHHIKYGSEKLGVDLFFPCEPSICPLLKPGPVFPPGTTFSLDDVNTAA